MKYIDAICPKETLEINGQISVYSCHAPKAKRAANCKVATLVEKDAEISKKICAYAYITHNTQGRCTFGKTIVNCPNDINPGNITPILAT